MKRTACVNCAATSRYKVQTWNGIPADSKAANGDYYASYAAGEMAPGTAVRVTLPVAPVLVAPRP